MCPHIVPVRSDQRMCLVLYALLAKIRRVARKRSPPLANMLHACSSVKWSVGRNDMWLCWPCHCSSKVRVIGGLLDTAQGPRLPRVKRC